MVDKEYLFRIIKNSRRKRKIKKVLEPILTVEGIDSPLVAQSISQRNFIGSESDWVRNSLRNIVNSYR